MTEDDIENSFNKWTKSAPRIEGGWNIQNMNTQCSDIAYAGFKAGVMFVCRNAEIELDDIPLQEDV